MRKDADKCPQGSQDGALVAGCNVIPGVSTSSCSEKTIMVKRWSANKELSLTKVPKVVAFPIIKWDASDESQCEKMISGATAWVSRASCKQGFGRERNHCIFQTRKRLVTKATVSSRCTEGTYCHRSPVGDTHRGARNSSLDWRNSLKA